jgi:fumarylacetoacetase
MYSHHFSINNIPFGIASSSSHAHKSVATRLEDTVIFLDELARHYPELSKEILTTFSKVSNNSIEAFFMAMANLVRKHSTPSPLSLKLSIDG